MSDRRRADLSEWFACIAINVLLFMAVWSWDHKSPELAEPLLYVCGAIVAITFLSIFLRGVRAVPGGVGRLLKDPVLYIGAALCAYLLIMATNSAWPTGMGDDVTVAWYSQAPERPGWPSSIDGPLARYVFILILCMVSTAVCIRQVFQTRSSVRILLTLVMCQGLLQALFGIVQYASGTDYQYWAIARGRHFFGSFSYENHASQYFYLTLCIAGAVLCHWLRRGKASGSIKALICKVALPIAFLFFAIVFSLGRAGIVFGGVALAVSGYYLLRLVAARADSSSQLQLFTAIAAVFLTAIVFASSTLGDDVRRDFSYSRPGTTVVGKALDSRTWQWAAALDLWRNNPVAGIGSNGFRYYVGYYVEGSEAGVLSQDFIGQAHNDYLQYLAEFGIVGWVGWMTVMLLLILRPIRAWSWQRPWILLPTLGAGMVLVHACLDLPFRSIPVATLWVIALCSAGQYAILSADLKSE